MSIPHRTIYRARRGGRLVPLAKSITPALRAFPPRKINYARSAGVPSSQNQLRPLCGRSLPLHLWRGGGRQAGGEVPIHFSCEDLDLVKALRIQYKVAPVHFGGKLECT